MKKRVLIVGAILSFAMLVTGCSTETLSNEYISISKYKGVEVPKVEGIPEITDEAVENNIKTVLNGFSKTKEITGQSAKEGDVVVLDYTTIVDGVPLDGEGTKDFELELGSGALSAEFEEDVIGHNKGDVYQFTQTFAEDFTNKTFAGKEVVFDITVKSINEKQTPELTDDFVQKISQKSKTVKEYKEEVRILLEENNQEYIFSELEEAAWAVILENTEVKSYPEDKIKKEEQTLNEHYQKGADYYKMEFSEFIKQMGLTEKEFKQNVKEAAQTNVRENLVTEAIADREKIELSDKEYKKEEKALAKEMGYADVKEMKKEAPEEYIKSYILRNEVKKWVAENCVQTKE